jgi:hypothetical protein
MRPRAHRRNLVVWSSSVGWADRHGASGLTQVAHTRRIHRFVRTSALLTVTGLVRLAHAVRPRWRPLLGCGLSGSVAVLMVRSGAWGALFLPGLLFLYSALLIPGVPEADRKRRSELERELPGYSAPAQRCDLEALLARCPASMNWP